MDIWIIVIYIFLLNDTVLTQRVSQPVFQSEADCKAFVSSPDVRQEWLNKYFRGTGVSYILPKCEKLINA